MLYKLVGVESHSSEWHKPSVPIFLFSFIAYIFFSIQASAEPASAMNAPVAPEVLVVRVAPLEFSNPQPQELYVPKLLELALAKTVATHGQYQLTFSPEPLPRERIFLELRKGHSIDVVWSPPNRDRLDDTIPIDFPIFKQLNSYRLLVIRAGDQKKFDAIADEIALKKLRMGASAAWPVTSIFQGNGFNVVTSMTSPSLFKMLAANRFDYLPRGIHQALSEKELYKSFGLTVEKRFLLYYDSPVLFFVHKNRPELAARIEEGLKLASEDGSFDKLFNSVESFKEGESVHKDPNRTMIRIYPLHTDGA